jgi:DNA-binding transcriptional LysR family regulator
VYAGMRDSLERARQAARGITAVLRVGVIPINAHDLRPFWDAFRSEHPQWQLRIMQASFVDPFAGLRRGDVDVLVAWLPVEEPDLTVGPILFAEPRVLAVAADHELTRHATVSLETLSDFRHSNAEGVGYWLDGFVPTHTRRGRAIERGPFVSNSEEIFTLVSTGEIVNLFPDHIVRYWARPDIAYLPVRDMDALPYAAIWRTDAENDLIRAFARTVRDLGPRIP